ncbi:MAG: hypothetical protein M9942_01810 [Microthrixaceae bacterium]|nr:hypothetical protein [Microthrixaceae bacterium]MCO5317152.1 hypothetical protein [Microthrixaceae bacterium]
MGTRRRALRDYQVVLDDGSAVVVRDGVFVDWKDTPLEDLPAPNGHDVGRFGRLS